jgi:Tfp pilus assembly protein PilX
MLGQRYNCEFGGIMIIVLMTFLLVSILAAGIIGMGVMEFRSSHFDFQSQQAQQAADAGVDWGLENIYTELTLPANLIAESLPSSLNCGNQSMYLNVGDKTCEVSIGNVINRTNPLTEEGSYTYEFTSAGTFEGAHKLVTVQAIYHFSGGYQYTDSNGTISFLSRKYLNRGRIISYQTTI